MANIDDLKNVERIELDDEMLNFVGGGVYSEEEWNNMTPEERKQAWIDSIKARAKKEYCNLD